jgi:hypothetical protein
MSRLFVPYRYIRTQSIVFHTLIHGGIIINFGKHLESKRIITKNRVPFYVAWVSQFYKFIDKKSTEEFTPEEVERFLKHLTKNREEWQVTQLESSKYRDSS